MFDPQLEHVCHRMKHCLLDNFCGFLICPKHSTFSIQLKAIVNRLMKKKEEIYNETYTVNQFIVMIFS